MKQCKWYQVCPIKYFTDQGMLEDRWVKNYCLGDWAPVKDIRLRKAEFHIPTTCCLMGRFEKN